MTNEPHPPLLGLFWFAKTPSGSTLFICKAKPFSEVQEIGGFRTLEEGHVDVWEAVRRDVPALRHHEYEDFPRGRVNWRAEDDRFLLLLDLKLDSSFFRRFVAKRWRLPPERTLVVTDSHYRSIENVGPPPTPER